jgi:predicted nucleic acid-binding protein
VTLLDTSVIIDFLTGDPQIVVLIKKLFETGDIKTTTITEYELLRHKIKIRKQAAEIFLSGATIYPFDSVAAREAALLSERLRDVGRMVNENDLLIAGISLAQGEVLLTRDKKLAGVDKGNIRLV